MCRQSISYLINFKQFRYSLKAEFTLSTDAIRCTFFNEQILESACCTLELCNATPSILCIRI